MTHFYWNETQFDVSCVMYRKYYYYSANNCYRWVDDVILTAWPLSLLKHNLLRILCGFIHLIRTFLLFIGLTSYSGRLRAISLFSELQWKLIRNGDILKDKLNELDKQQHQLNRNHVQSKSHFRRDESIKGGNNNGTTDRKQFSYKFVVQIRR
eukprot:209316_1